jgi:predicted RNase H-like nuclease (RuvC/YqgF family)
MKRLLLIASIIGLFMATAMDLQAQPRRKGLPRIVRAGIAVLSQIQYHDNHNRYDRYNIHQARQIAREIRRNEKRIWKLEKRMAKLYRRGGNTREIHELEREIYWLERRNDHLRNQLY